MERLPYFPDQAIETLSKFAWLVLAGTREPVAFFGYPGLPSFLIPEGCRPVLLARPEEDVAAALEALAEELRAPKGARKAAETARPLRPSGKLTTHSLGEAVAALQPENAIIVDESATSGLPYFLASSGTPRHSYLGHTGGAIGQGLPSAAGAALACPDRRVIALQADGSGMYTVQALWTHAREGLNITSIICANRA